MTLYQQLRQIQLMVPAFKLKLFWDERFRWDTAIEVFIKDHFMKNVQYNTRICYLKQDPLRRNEKISQNLFGRAGSFTMILRLLKLNLYNVQKNRLSEKCGEGSCLSRHTGGSRTHREHARQLANILGQPPHPHELMKKTHTKANNESADLKSKCTYMNLASLQQLTFQKFTCMK